MNEFLAFLVLLWHIVKFFLDAASYILCAICLVISCILPWRIFQIINETELERVDCVKYMFITLCELVCWAFCLPSLIIPSRLVGVAAVFCKSGHGNCDKNGAGNPKFEYFFFLFRSPFVGIVEVIAFVLGLFSLLSIVRTRQVILDVRKAAGREWEDDLFNAEIIAACCVNGATTFVDLVFLPMTMVLACTMWRAPPVFKELQQGFSWVTRAVIFKQFVWLLADIFVSFPSLLLACVTVYRFPPIFKHLVSVCTPAPKQPTITRSGYSPMEGPMEDQGVSSTPPDQGVARKPSDEAAENHQMKLPPDEVARKRMEDECEGITKLTPTHRLLAKTTGLIFLDVCCLPMILVLLLSWYRFSAITAGLPGTRFHKEVWKQFRQFAMDAPFIFAGLLLLLSMYRVDLIYKIVRDENQTAWQRRKGVGIQFLRMLGDVASLLPLAIIVCTVYRLVPLAMSMKVRMTQLLRESPEMSLREWRFNLERPKGKPRFIIGARKNANLTGIVSMQLQVVGDGFWAAIAQAKGGFVAAAGRAMLPLALRNGKEVDYSRFQHGQTEIELEVELDFTVKHSTALKFLQALPVDVELLLQLEATLEAGRKTVLLAVPCQIAQLVEALSSEEYRFVAAEATEEGTANAEEHLATLRGIPVLRRDAWLPIVMVEFGQVLLDIAHVCIAMVLLIVFPWRMFAMVREFREPGSLREAKKAFRVATALQSWQRVSETIMVRAERLANRYAKAASEDACRQTCTARQYRRPKKHGDVESCVEDCIGCFCCVFCPCCPNYNDWDADDWEVDRRYYSYYYMRRKPIDIEFDKQLRQLCKSLPFYRKQLRTARKKWPDDPSWIVLSEEVDKQIRQKSDAFFWMLLLNEVHILRSKRAITDDEHVRVCRAIRNRALHLLDGAEGAAAKLQCDFRERVRDAAQERGKRKLSKALLYALLRIHLVKAFTDILAIPVGLILLLTVYRIPRIKEEIDGHWDVAFAKMVLKRQAVLLLQDISRLVQFTVLSVLVIVTIVKLPDFLSSLKPSRGLRKARDCAFSAFCEVVVGIFELLFLLTAWKTYRLLVSAIVFGLLSPAAMLAMALPGTGSKTKFRFGVTSICWLGLLLASFWLSALHSLIALAILLALAWIGFCFNNVKGFIRPRGGSDWWSPIVRWTFANFQALLAIAIDAVVLAWLGGWRRGPENIQFVRDSFGERFNYVACGMVGATLLVETFPMVSDETEQPAMITSHMWMAATALTKEVLLLPIIFLLAPSALALHGVDSTLKHMSMICLMFFSTISLFGSAIWDVDLGYETLLDIRYVNASASGRKLLMIAAALCGIAGESTWFIAFASATALWVLLWTPFGSSTPTVGILRFGACVGAVAPRVQSFGQHAVVLVWIIAVVSACVSSLVAHLIRRRKLESSQVPTAMRQLQQLQESLALWGRHPTNGASEVLRADADVKGTARRVLELEERLPIECLDPAFFEERGTWRSSLSDAASYEIVLTHIERLRAMIAVPVTRVLMQQVLAKLPASTRRILHLPLAKEIANFAVPPIAFDVPEPHKGWEFGSLDLGLLRREAGKLARQIPAMIHTSVGSEKSAFSRTIGRDYISYFDEI